MKKIIVIFLVIIALWGIWKIYSFEMFDVENISLARISVKGKRFVIGVNYIAPGATAEDVIQVRKMYGNGEIDVVKNFTEYNNFIDATLINDSLLKLVLSDTGYYNSRPDTLVIKFK
ncbi:hypothetical protein [Chitinophaga sp.]|uniref:hypothetical protein n=1 Tax=Chitinophaga sp. TaxID=1869181 RepID=UPI0031E1485D